MVDDLKPAIKSFGDMSAVTPNIDKLSKKSAIFTNNHVQIATCSPSRISYLTGKRPDYTKSYQLQTSMRKMRPNIVTIPQYYRNNGYTTVGIGKVFDGRSVTQHDKPSWDKFYSPFFTKSFNENYDRPKYGYQNEEKKRIMDSLVKKSFPDGPPPGTYMYRWFKNRYKPPYSSSPKPDDTYPDGAIASFAVKALDTIGKNGKPFFFAVGFSKPHIPFVAPEKYWNYYNKEDITLASFQERAENSSRKIYHSSGELRGHVTPEIKYGLKNGLAEVNEDIQKNLVHGYYACVSFIDAQIGKIVDKLESTGLIKNTIIVIWGDHGYHLGDHSLWNKHTVLEQATRTALLIYDPSTNKPQVIDSPTESIDVFPTLCDLTNLNKLDYLDGKSLKSSMDNGVSSKKYAVSQFEMFGSKNKMAYGFRPNIFRYIMFFDKQNIGKNISKNDIEIEALFDYKNDPNETKNFIGYDNYLVIENQIRNDAINFLNNYFKKI